MPGRKYTAGSLYRYGFNGKENDNDIKGEGNQQDYGMRIYDTRLGKFLSVDPITVKYPELTPYQFASNRPIDGIDLDGLEYCPYIPRFNTEGRGVIDYVGAIDNGVIDVLNIVPSLWNSCVSTYQSIRRGTYGEDLKRDTKQVGSSLKQVGIKIWNEPLKTLTSPQALEFLVSMYVGAKITLPAAPNKGSLTSPVKTVPSIALGLDAIEIDGTSTRILRSFSDKTLSLNHKQWSTAFGTTATGNSFSQIFNNVTRFVTEKGGVIKFDLTGFDFKRAVGDIGKSAEAASSYTNWEFLQVIGNNKLLNATRFYENGVIMKTEDVLKKFATEKK